MKPARRQDQQGVAPRSFLTDFFSDFDRMFDSDIFRMPMQANRQVMANMPATNIREGEKSFDIEVAAPGMAKDDFSIDVNDGVLNISCQKESSNTDNQDNYTRREYNYSSFSRSFRLPEGIKEDDIKAKYNDGILHIAVPKGKEKEKPSRRISID